MPFHMFGPPHLPVLPILLSSALALAAGAYLGSRKGMPASVLRAGVKLKARMRGLQCARGAHMRGDANRMYSTSQNARNSSGNSAFDAYRSATLSKLEQEAAELRSYLDELRHAKDRSEFDAFLKERRAKPTNETSSP